MPDYLYPTNLREEPSITTNTTAPQSNRYALHRCRVCGLRYNTRRHEDCPACMKEMKG